jgi:hypothetical protein
MAAIRVREEASHRLDEIYRYTRDGWGTKQEGRYITGLFEAFDKIETRGVLSSPIPAEFGVDGFFPLRTSFSLLAKSVERRHRHRDDSARANAPD